MEQTVVMTDPKKTDYFYNEAMKTLRTNIQFAGRNLQCLLFTSCFPNEGKSDITFQLAREMGNIGKKVLFLDADIRKSNIVSRYQVHQQVKGLSQFLSGQAEGWDPCYETNYPNMDIIFSGLVTPNPSELLEDAAFGELIKNLRKKYDYILIDTPPIGSIIDAAIIAKQCDGAVLVVESESVGYRYAQRAKEQIERAGCKVLGAVLNKVDVSSGKYYSKYSYYYYHKDKK